MEEIAHVKYFLQIVELASLHNTIVIQGHLGNQNTQEEHHEDNHYQGINQLRMEMGIHLTEVHLSHTPFNQQIQAIFIGLTAFSLR